MCALGRSNFKCCRLNTRGGLREVNCADQRTGSPSEWRGDVALSPVINKTPARPIMNMQQAFIFKSIKKKKLPWPVWLSGLSAGLQTIKVAGSIPSQGTCQGCRHARGSSKTSVFLSLSFYSLPLSLKVNKICFEEEEGKEKELRNSDVLWNCP